MFLNESRREYTKYEFDNTFNILYYENKYTKHFYALNKNDFD